MAWTEEKREKVVAEYVDTMQNEYDSDEARAAANVEVIKELADIHEETSNGVRIILGKAGVYIKPQAKAASTSSNATTKRINKTEAQQTLRNLINDIGDDLVDEDIISKMTGKAAAYFSGVLIAATSGV